MHWVVEGGAPWWLRPNHQAVGLTHPLGGCRPCWQLRHASAPYQQHTQHGELQTPHTLLAWYLQHHACALAPCMQVKRLPWSAVLLGWIPKTW